MELLEKYLQAVKFWLPSSQQADIAAELRDDIRSQVEERESELGRSLNKDEWEALLKQRGNPLLVAEKYLPPQSLIGPVLFPAYKFVLKIVLLCYFLPSIAGWMGLILFNSQYRANHLGPALLGDLFFLFFHALASAAIVTLVFAILDRTKNQSWFVDDWIRKLPRVRDTQRIPRASSGTELIFNIIFGVWWLKILWTLVLFDAGGTRVLITPAWHRFFWFFLPLWIFNIGFSTLNLVRPYWTRARHGMRAALNVATGIVMVLVIKSSMPMVVEGPLISGGKAAIIWWSVYLGLSISFSIAAVVCLVTAVVEVWRAVKTEPAPPQLSHGIAL